MAPGLPTLPVIHPSVKNAWATCSPLNARVTAEQVRMAAGLVVAISTANASMTSGSTPQISLAHSGVLGTPS